MNFAVTFQLPRGSRRGQDSATAGSSRDPEADKQAFVLACHWGEGAKQQATETIHTAA